MGLQKYNFIFTNKEKCFFSSFFFLLPFFDGSKGKFLFLTKQGSFLFF
jgi:hypothetical protein